MAVDLTACLDQIAVARVNGDGITQETALLAEVVVRGFQREFSSTLDMKTCGKALVIAASAVVPLCHAEMPAIVVANLIAGALAGMGNPV